MSTSNPEHLRLMAGAQRRQAEEFRERAREFDARAARLELLADEAEPACREGSAPK